MSVILNLSTDAHQRLVAVALRNHRTYLGARLAKARNKPELLSALTTDVEALDDMLKQVEPIDDGTA